MQAHVGDHTLLIDVGDPLKLPGDVGKRPGYQRDVLPKPFSTAKGSPPFERTDYRVQFHLGADKLNQPRHIPSVEGFVARSNQPAAAN